jgi:hypothetical protein
VISDTLLFGRGGLVCESMDQLLMPAESWVLHYMQRFTSHSTPLLGSFVWTGKGS